MAAVVGVTLAILIIFLILVIGLLIAYKKEKMCFKSKFHTYDHQRNMATKDFTKLVPLSFTLFRVEGKK